MTSLARQPLYKEDLLPAVPAPQKSKRTLVKALAKPAPRALSAEDAEIVAALNTVKYDLDCLHNRYDNTADGPVDGRLVESLIYEIKAANIKYEYYLSLCKEKGIVSGVTL